MGIGNNGKYYVIDAYGRKYKTVDISEYFKYIDILSSDIEKKIFFDFFKDINIDIMCSTDLSRFISIGRPAVYTLQKPVCMRPMQTINSSITIIAEEKLTSEILFDKHVYNMTSLKLEGMSGKLVFPDSGDITVKTLALDSRNLELHGSLKKVRFFIFNTSIEAYTHIIENTDVIGSVADKSTVYISDSKTVFRMPADIDFKNIVLDFKQSCSIKVDLDGYNRSFCKLMIENASNSVIDIDIEFVNSTNGYEPSVKCFQNSIKVNVKRS